MGKHKKLSKLLALPVLALGLLLVLAGCSSNASGGTRDAKTKSGVLSSAQVKKNINGH